MNKLAIFGTSRRSAPAPRPLEQYVHSRDKNGFKRRAAVLWTMLVFVAFLYGGMYALFPPAFLPPMLIPILVGIVFVIWALPEARAAPTRLLYWLFLAFFVCLITWPNYLAISIPGIPWITLIRLTGIPLALVLLVCVSVSEEFRSRVKRSLNAAPLIWKILAAFVLMQMLSIAFSNHPFQSTQRFVIAQIYWTSIFFCSCYIFLTPGRVTRMAMILAAMAVYVSVIALWEWRLGHVPWAGRIPSFIKVDDESVLRTLAGSMRAGTGLYRVQSTFSTPLGLAEYLALTTPFLIHLVLTADKLFVRALSVGAIAFTFLTIYNSNARLGAVGFFLSFLLYAGLWAIRRWRLDRTSILGPAITVGYPAILAAFFTASVFIGRLRRMVWGGGEHTFSTEARETQFQMGLPKIFSSPFGHGIGQSGETLGFVTPSGMLTVDSYYLTIGLDYGPLGFVIYYSIFIAAVTYGIFALIRAREGEQSYLLPITVALLTFLVIKSVFSQEDNHPIVFMLLGALCALIARVKASDQEERSRSSAST